MPSLHCVGALNSSIKLNVRLINFKFLNYFHVVAPLKPFDTLIEFSNLKGLQTSSLTQIYKMFRSVLEEAVQNRMNYWA